MKKGTAIIMVLTGLLILGAQLSIAQRPPLVPGSEENLIIPHPFDATESSEQYFSGVLLPTITQTIIALSGACAFLFIILGGIQILTAYGNEEKIANGKKTVTYAIVGLVIAILSYAIVSIISAVQLGNSPVPSGGGGGSGQTENSN